MVTIFLLDLFVMYFPTMVWILRQQSCIKSDSVVTPREKKYHVVALKDSAMYS